MGFFGWLGGKIKVAANKMISDTKRVGCVIKRGVTNVWNIFSGRRTFYEADKLYEQITDKYQERRRRFQKQVEDYTAQIEMHVATINASKEKIKSELFPEMAKKMQKIKDIKVSEDFSVEEYIAEVLSFDSLRTKEQLYKIDFNKHKFKTSFQAILTAGFYTRKKAKETLLAVQEEEGKINTEIEKMDAEIIKLKAIENSLKIVADYFVSFIEIYESLLVRLDNSVNFLYVRCMSMAHKLVSREMSIRRLPVMQQKEVEAIISASKILKVMTDTQITSLEDEDKVKEYRDKMKEQNEKLNQVYDAA